MAQGKESDRSPLLSTCSAIEILDKLDELLGLAADRSAPAAGHVQLAVRSGIRKRKRHQTARLYRVLGGFFGNDGDAQTSGYQIFDGFLIVQPRRDRQVVSSTPIRSK